MVFATHQHEAIDIHVAPPSWTSSHCFQKSILYVCVSLAATFAMYRFLNTYF